MVKMQGSFWSGKSIRKHLSSGDSVPSWGTILLYFEIFLLFTFTVPSPHLAHVSPRSVFMEFKVCTLLRRSSLQSSQWDHTEIFKTEGSSCHLVIAQWATRGHISHLLVSIGERNLFSVYSW